MVSPHFAKYNVGEDEDVMDYKSGLASNYTTKSVSLADAKNGSKEAKVIVQFAHTYSEDAHRLLVASQAPRLHRCKATELRCGLITPRSGGKRCFDECYAHRVSPSEAASHKATSTCQWVVVRWLAQAEHIGRAGPCGTD